MNLDSAGGDEMLSWYGFNCWSEAEGDCGTMPYSMGSFTVMPGTDPGSDGTCLVLAEMGVAKARSIEIAVSVVVGVVLAVWLVL